MKVFRVELAYCYTFLHYCEVLAPFLGSMSTVVCPQVSAGQENTDMLHQSWLPCQKSHFRLFLESRSAWGERFRAEGRADPTSEAFSTYHTQTPHLRPGNSGSVLHTGDPLEEHQDSRQYSCCQSKHLPRYHQNTKINLLVLKKCDQRF